MRRGYSSEKFYHLVEKIRQIIPGVSIATDIIVGFPGETDEQFQHTYDLLRELKLDVAHLARYSSRPNTLATRKMTDDVPEDVKQQRFRSLEQLQEGIISGIHSHLLGKTLEVLFEEKVHNRWRGRTVTNKLVFVETEDNLRGEIRPVEITRTGPWSMIGQITH
jgi:tRNA-2-methylthio-N6-dimethylallyladenosine synthase